MRLLESQKNILYKLIEIEGDFSPNQFLFFEIQSRDNGDFSSSLKFKNSDYSFEMFKNRDYHKSYFVNYTPGIDSFMEISGNLSWDGILKEFGNWLKSLKREISEPLLWNQLLENLSDANTRITAPNNLKFTAREYFELQQKMEIVIDKVSHLPLIEEQQNQIISQLNHLTVIALDLGKLDWTNLLVGTLISIITQFTITKENASMIWAIIRNTFSSLFLK